MFIEPRARAGTPEPSRIAGARARQPVPVPEPEPVPQCPSRKKPEPETEPEPEPPAPVPEPDPVSRSPNPRRKPEPDPPSPGAVSPSRSPKPEPQPEPSEVPESAEVQPARDRTRARAPSVRARAASPSRRSSRPDVKPDFKHRGGIRRARVAAARNAVAAAMPEVDGGAELGPDQGRRSSSSSRCSRPYPMPAPEVGSPKTRHGRSLPPTAVAAAPRPNSWPPPALASPPGTMQAVELPPSVRAIRRAAEACTTPNGSLDLPRRRGLGQGCHDFHHRRGPRVRLPDARAWKKRAAS